MLYSRSWGDPHKATVVLLHGWAGSSLDWQPVAEWLRSSYHLLALDLPGHGKSRFEDASDFSFERTTELISATLDAQHVEQCALAGYSMGGRLALALALENPSRYTKLILESTSPGIDDDEAREARKAWDDETAARLLHHPIEAFFASWYKMPLFESLRHHPLFEQMLQKRLQNDPGQIALSMRHAGTGSMPSLWERWPQLAIDTLLIVGEYDEKYRQISREMAAANPRALRQIIGSAGHNVHVEQPQTYARLLQEWLGDL